MHISNKIIGIILIYAYIVIAYLNLLDIKSFKFAISMAILAWTIYSNWRIKGLDNPNSFEYLWHNNKKEFIENFLIFASIIITLMV